MNETPIRVLLSVGANLGDRRKNIAAAVARLRANKHIRGLEVSAIYETDPVGMVKQAKFLNAAIGFKTSLGPRALLRYLKSVERALGRKPSRIKWGPRVIDLDILFYGNLILREKNLSIPHPLLQEREFVLAPLSEIASGTIHPVYKKSVKTLWKKLRDETGKKR